MQPTPPAAREALSARDLEQPQDPLSAIVKHCLTDRFPPPTSTGLKIPKIGEYWAGQGGVNAGLRITPDGTQLFGLILCLSEPDYLLSWSNAINWAHTLKVGHSADFSLPDRAECLHIYSTLKHLVDQYAWYWTSTQDADEGFAWSHDFEEGYQQASLKGLEKRVMAVRKVPLIPSDLMGRTA